MLSWDFAARRRPKSEVPNGQWLQMQRWSQRGKGDPKEWIVWHIHHLAV